MKNVLITGASGFAGGYLAEHLLEGGQYKIVGTYNSPGSNKKSPVFKKIDFVHVDFQDKSKVKKLLSDIKPDLIFHLAAQASVPESIKNPIATFHSNVDSQLNLFDSMQELGLTRTATLVVSSAEVYGFVRPDELPMDENTPHRPANPYAVSKIAQDYLGFQYHLSFKLPIVRVRPFNHIGPRQNPPFVVADFAKQIAEIEKGKREPIMRLGNLEAKRDFTDVRDMVKAYPLLLEKGRLGEVYNAGSGTSVRIGDILGKLLSFTKTYITIESDPEKFRPSDTPEIVADITKIQSATGWRPEISLEKSLEDALNYWRNVF